MWQVRIFGIRATLQVCRQVLNLCRPRRHGPGCQEPGKEVSAALFHGRSQGSLAGTKTNRLATVFDSSNVKMRKTGNENELKKKIAAIISLGN